MYSTGLIQHEGVTYSPDGRVTLGESETLDCGLHEISDDDQDWNFRYTGELPN